MQGVVRFALFIAVITLGFTVYYSNELRQTVASQQAAITVLTSDRDASKTQAETARKTGAENESALKEAQAKIADLQAQLEAAKKPAPRRR